MGRIPAEAVIPFLVAMMLASGVANTLLTKYQDMQCVLNCDDPDPKKRSHFEQPVMQTLQMFVGESGCWLVVGTYSLVRRIKQRRAGYSAVPDSEASTGDSSPTLTPETPIAKALSIKSADNRIPLTGRKIFLLAIPACCDIMGTTLMMVGFLFVAASIYQMTRGALVLFVGLFSVVFLKRKLFAYQWFSLVVVVLGVAIVGLSSVLFPDHLAVPGSGKGATDKTSITMAFHTSMRSAVRVAKQAKSPEAIRSIIGVVLIAAAQVFTATQFVVEEYILERYALEPIKVVGWEGVFGFSVTLVVMIVMHLLVGRTPEGEGGYFNAVAAWNQVIGFRPVLVSSILIMISIGGFNFFGLSVTRTVSATSRSTIDTCRTLFIWLASLGLGWETFKWLQVLGFALLVYGTFLFNNIIRPPIKRWAQTAIEEPAQIEEPTNS
ncbi:MAG: hypothetical protein M1814_005639 [Vezdaea aestivalis]|nr:MAG: hypothetical protein M1814_005639 [Vezdaea aestivalis]